MFERRKRYCFTTRETEMFFSFLLLLGYYNAFRSENVCVRVQMRTKWTSRFVYGLSCTFTQTHTHAGTSSSMFVHGYAARTLMCVGVCISQFSSEVRTWICVFSKKVIFSAVNFSSHVQFWTIQFGGRTVSSLLLVREFTNEINPRKASHHISIAINFYFSSFLQTIVKRVRRVFQFEKKNRFYPSNSTKKSVENASYSWTMVNTFFFSSIENSKYPILSNPKNENWWNEMMFDLCDRKSTAKESVSDIEIAMRIACAQCARLTVNCDNMLNKTRNSVRRISNRNYLKKT